MQTQGTRLWPFSIYGSSKNIYCVPPGSTTCAMLNSQALKTKSGAHSQLVLILLNYNLPRSTPLFWKRGEECAVAVALCKRAFSLELAICKAVCVQLASGSAQTEAQIGFMTQHRAGCLNRRKAWLGRVSFPQSSRVTWTLSVQK